MGLTLGAFCDELLPARGDIGAIELEFLQADDFVRIGLIPACAFPVAFRQRLVETGDFLLQLRTLLLGAGLLARHFLGDEVWTFQDAMDALPDLTFGRLGTPRRSTAQHGI